MLKADIQFLLSFIIIPVNALDLLNFILSSQSPTFEKDILFYRYWLKNYMCSIDFQQRFDKTVWVVQIAVSSPVTH